MSRMTFLKLALLAVMSVSVVGCALGDAQPRPQPTLAYRKYPPVRLNVARVEVVDQYGITNKAPYIENQMAAPLPDVVHDWAQNRFQAMGQDGVLTITITKASMIREDLQRTQGIKGVFTVDQSERVTGDIAVSFSATGMSFGTSGTAQVNAKGSRTVAEDASLQQQDIVLANLTDSLLVELDAATQRVFAEKLPSLMQQGGLR